jgi:hypothetical protein
VTFSISVAEGKHVSGRVLLDVKAQCVRPKRIDIASPLWNFGNALLVETFREVRSEPLFVAGESLIPGIFVDKDALKEGMWFEQTHEVIDPTKIEFPEFLIPEASGPRFARGEVELPLDIDNTELERIAATPTLKSSFALGDICLYYLGLKHLMSHEHHEAMNLARTDLRFSEHRGRVYRLLGEDPNEPYFALATRHGHDPRRFFA